MNSPFMSRVLFLCQFLGKAAFLCCIRAGHRTLCFVVCGFKLKALLGGSFKECRCGIRPVVWMCTAVAATLPSKCVTDVVSAPSQYCGSSLSRVGMDFQGLLQPLFELCILRAFSSNIAAVLDAFGGRLETHKWLPLPTTPIFSRGGRKASADERLQPDHRGALSVQASSGDLAPPAVVMAHLPLAVLLNGVLATLNELRYCALLGLADALARWVGG